MTALLDRCAFQPARASDTPAPWKALLKKYGWKPTDKVTYSDIEIPKALTGPAFNHYQSCSERIGLSLQDLRGQKVPFCVVVLEKKTGRSNSEMRAYFVIHKNRCMGAWLATSAPVAPGIGSLDDPNFGDKM